jgi:hypothetical protein
MHLSAFGVESDNFPSIDAVIDFEHDSSLCKKSFYSPAYKPSSYRLSPSEMKQVRHLLQNTNFRNLKTSYTSNKSDQPTSTTIIYRTRDTVQIKDYGLQADEPLKELYTIVYKF